jgi:hypothetical protein
MNAAIGVTLSDPVMVAESPIGITLASGQRYFSSCHERAVMTALGLMVRVVESVWFPRQEGAFSSRAAETVWFGRQ